jgi:transcriptional regulator with XRE-family HTH domain
MKLVSHKELHNEWMQDDEYRAAWQEEERKEKLRELLAEWRKHDNLTKAQVAERMGVTPPVISRLENNITKASIDTLTRYAHACGIKKPVIVLNSQPSGAGLFVSVSPKILLKQV